MLVPMQQSCYGKIGERLRKTNTEGKAYRKQPCWKACSTNPTELLENQLCNISRDEWGRTAGGAHPTKINDQKFDVAAGRPALLETDAQALSQSTTIK